MQRSVCPEQDTGGFFITVFEKVAPIKGAANGKDTPKQDSVVRAARALSRHDYTPSKTSYGPRARAMVASQVAKADKESAYQALKKLNKGQGGFKEDPYFFKEDIEEDFWTELKVSCLQI